MITLLFSCFLFPDHRRTQQRGMSTYKENASAKLIWSFDYISIALKLRHFYISITMLFTPSPRALHRHLFQRQGEVACRHNDHDNDSNNNYHYTNSNTNSTMMILLIILLLITGGDRDDRRRYGGRRQSSYYYHYHYYYYY